MNSKEYSKAYDAALAMGYRQALSTYLSPLKSLVGTAGWSDGYIEGLKYVLSVKELQLDDLAWTQYDSGQEDK